MGNFTAMDGGKYGENHGTNEKNMGKTMRKDMKTMI